MREKLLDLMKNEGLKPSQLAELLGINPAGISHILAGRNKPGFDLLQKILRRFPRINPDWLLLDSDKMYRDEPPAQSSAPQPTSQPASPGGDLFGLASGRHPLEEKRQPETAENATAGGITRINKSMNFINCPQFGLNFIQAMSVIPICQ